MPAPRTRSACAAFPLVRPIELEPMLARNAKVLPTGDGWLFEPKWDGYRCLVFRDEFKLLPWFGADIVTSAPSLAGGRRPTCPRQGRSS